MPSWWQCTMEEQICHQSSVTRRIVNRGKVLIRELRVDPVADGRLHFQNRRGQVSVTKCKFPDKWQRKLCILLSVENKEEFLVHHISTRAICRETCILPLHQFGFAGSENTIQQVLPTQFSDKEFFRILSVAVTGDIFAFQKYNFIAITRACH